jgi:hypothetical protein
MKPPCEPATLEEDGVVCELLYENGKWGILAPDGMALYTSERKPTTESLRRALRQYLESRPIR